MDNKNPEPEIFRFTIYRQPSSDEKRGKESVDIVDFLQHLRGFVKLDDVHFGQPPNEPDFVFRDHDKHVGVELTDLDPRIFKKNGFVQRGRFKKWQAETKPSETPQKFNWGKYSMRESLAALKARLDAKRKKATKWSSAFAECWLLMHIARGSPFSEVFGRGWKTAPGKEEEVADYFAKLTYGVHSICQDIQPFDYVFLFRQEGFVAFPAITSNPRRFPLLDDEIVKRGAQASDMFLDWTRTSNSVTRSFDIWPNPPEALS